MATIHFSLFEKGLEVCYCPGAIQTSPGVLSPSRSHSGSEGVPSRFAMCFVFHPGPEVGAIPARPGPILLPSVPSRIGPGWAETPLFMRKRTPRIYPKNTPKIPKKYPKTTLNARFGYLFRILRGIFLGPQKMTWREQRGGGRIIGGGGVQNRFWGRV